MDIRIVSLIICYTGLLSICGSRAQFPFQGPVLYDPYAPFFSSNELNPFSSNDMHYIARHNYHKRPHRHIHKELIHPHRHSHRSHARQTEDRDVNPEQINEERDRKRNLYESEPSKWRKYSRTVYSTEPAVKRTKQSSSLVPKHNDDNNGLIRPKLKDLIQTPESNQNNYNQKPLNYPNLNYKNSNTFRQLVPKRSAFRGNPRSSKGSDKRKDESSEDDSTLDIDMNGEEDEDEHNHDHHRDHNSGQEKPGRNDRQKVQYTSPPKDFTTNRPNYRVRERTLISDDSRYKRPALYEIEAPKNLGRDRPNGGSGYVQKIPVPQKVLKEIAELSAPIRSSTRRPHPFEGFHSNPRPKPETEIIVNNIGNDMTRQVGATLNVGSDRRNIQPKGKIFDEPLVDRDRRHDNNNRFVKSYSEIPFRPNDRNPFNAKQYETLQSETRNVDDSEDDPDIDDDNNQSENPSIFENQKKPQFKYFTEESSQRPPTSPLESEAQRIADEEAGDGSEDGEWTSNGGIPGEPGKDYPLLADVGYGTERSEFSCRGRPIGFYADVSQKCQVYHQCSPQGGQRFICPNGTLFSQESLVCEWWYNVLCENSEKLYERNQDLYTNNNQKQSDDISNDEKINDNESQKSWNYDNNPNDNQNNNNDNYDRHQSHHKYHNHNHRPHSHYSGNEFGANSDRKEQVSRAPATKTDEIDIDLSNDESKNRFVKTLSNHQIVSKFNPMNKTRNVVLLS